MRITYNDREEVYRVEIEYPETLICIGTSNIAEAKKFCIEQWSRIFDETVCKQFREDTLRKRRIRIWANGHLIL